MGLVARCVLTAAVLMCAAGELLAAAPGLLVAPDGYYAVTVDSSGKPVMEKITNVMVLGNAPTPPTGGGGGGGGGGTSSLADAIATMSKSKIPDADEGTALVAACQLLLKNLSSDEGIEQLLDRTIPVVGLGLGAKTRVDAWYAALKEVPGFTFTRAGLQEVLKGLQKAYNVDGQTVQALVDATQQGVQDGKSVEDINDELVSANPNAAFDFTMILTILMTIIDVLKQLGVIM
jgi:hypothetical protein